MEHGTSIISNIMSYTCNTELQVYMDALGLLLRLDTRDKLDEFLDRLKILANCLTDEVNNPSICLPCIYLHFLQSLRDFNCSGNVVSGVALWYYNNLGIEQSWKHFTGTCIARGPQVPVSSSFSFVTFFKWNFCFLTHLILTEHLRWARRNNSWCRKPSRSVLIDTDL